MNEGKFFKKAVKSKSKLRLGVFGPAGSGKTFSALRIARGIVGTNGTIAVIDTEAGSSAKYADRFSFDMAALETASIDNMIELIEGASGYDVLIIDSGTHAWQELIAEVEKLAKAKYAGNTWSAWSEGTPRQKRFIKAMLNSNSHIIMTMRSKTEYDVQKDERTGKSKPVRIGLQPETGKGMEYEFDILMQISPEHVAEILKDRTGKFQDQIIERPDEKFGEMLAAWLNEGADITAASVDAALDAKAANEADEKRLMLALPDDVKAFFKENKMTVKVIKESFCRPAAWQHDAIRELIDTWKLDNAPKIAVEA